MLSFVNFPFILYIEKVVRLPSKITKEYVCSICLVKIKKDLSPLDFRKLKTN